MAPLRAALAAPMQVVTSARLSDDLAQADGIAAALPAGAPLSAVLAAVDYVTRTRPPYRMLEGRFRLEMVRLLEARGRELALAERMHLLRAPINLRDPRVADGIAQFLRAYQADLCVRVRRALAPSGLLAHLADTLALAAPGARAQATADTLVPLESLHRLLTAYLWLALRNQVVWPDIEDATALKADCERAMNWCLARVSRGTPRARAGPTIKHREGGLSRKDRSMPPAEKDPRRAKTRRVVSTYI
jgi:ATP-dependent RNA helicase SUPV3L1/SUV3